MKLSLKEELLAPNLLEENLAKIEMNKKEIARLKEENSKLNAYNGKLEKIIKDNQEFFKDNKFIIDGGTVLVHELFGKRYRDLTPKQHKKYDKIRNHEYYEKHNASKHKKYDSTWCVETFGKRYRDLSKEELKEYNRIKQQQIRENKIIEIVCEGEGE